MYIRWEPTLLVQGDFFTNQVASCRVAVIKILNSFNYGF